MFGLASLTKRYKISMKFLTILSIVKLLAIEMLQLCLRTKPQHS